jgi:hypothetical protein
VVDHVLRLAAFTTGILLGLFLLGSLPHRVRPWAALAGLVVGFVAVCLAWQPWQEKPLLAWPWYAPLGSLTTAGIALILDSWRAPHGSSGDGGTQPGVGAAR